MALSTFSYNGIALSLVKTRMLARDNVFSADGSDLLYTKHTYMIDAVYNPGATSFQPPSSAGGPPVASAGVLPADTDLAIRERLMEPRKTLVHQVGDRVVLASPAPGSTVDALNGPRPISCNIREIHATKTFIIAYHIETYVSECSSAYDAAANPLVSNRYETTHSIDDQDRTVVTTSGIAVFRMDGLEKSATRNADHFRNQCLPPMPTGFQRQQLTIRVSPAGDRLTWQTVDVEVMTPIGDNNPFGVKAFTAIYTQGSAPVDNNGTQSIFDFASVDVSVVGNKLSTRVNLLLWAVRLGLERLAIKAGPVVGADPLIRMVQVQEYLHDRRVDFRIQVNLPPGKLGGAGLGAINARFLGIPLVASVAANGSSPSLPFDGNTRGTYTGELFAASLQAACTTPELVKAYGTSSPGTQAPNASGYVPPQQTSVGTGSLYPFSATKYNNAQTYSASYSDYKIRARWRRYSGFMSCPPAGKPTDRPAMLALHTPMKTVVYTFSGERNGLRPLVPNPAHNDSRYVLTDSHVDLHEAYLAPDGMTPVFRVEGEYTYTFDAPGDLDVEFPFPAVPWTEFLSGDAQIKMSDYTHGMIDPMQPVTYDYPPDQPTEQPPGDEPAQPSDPVTPTAPTDPNPPIYSPPGSHGTTDPGALETN